MNWKQKMTKLFFTSDNHFSHKNILKYQPEDRPFADIDEMNEMIIERHNSVVGKDDQVYFLGDFAFTNLNNTIEILERLNGRKFLVYGNHDRVMRDKKIDSYFEWRKQYYELNLKGYGYTGYAPMVLFHYPIERWNRKSYGAYHLFGHVHSSEYNDDLRLNVGVDSHNLTPWELTEIMEYFKNEERVKNNTSD